MQKDPAFTAKRIVWALRKQKLPGLHTILYDRSEELPHDLKAMAESGTLGTPVACCVESHDQWALIGTLGIAGCNDGRHPSVLFADIREINTVKGLLRDDTAGTVKHNMTHRPELRLMQITDNCGKRHIFQFATPQELTAFWNVLLRLTRTDGKQTGLR